MPQDSTSSAPASTPCRCGASRSRTPPRRHDHDDRSSWPARRWAHSTSRASTHGRAIAMFGTADVTGPISIPVVPPRTATVADLAAGAPDSVTVGILLMSMLDAESYPWEQISRELVRPQPGGGRDGLERLRRAACAAGSSRHSSTPSTRAPASRRRFAAPTASFTTPAGTVAVPAVRVGIRPGRLDSSTASPARSRSTASVLAIAASRDSRRHRHRDRGLVHRHDAARDTRGGRRADERRARRHPTSLSGAAPLRRSTTPTHNLVNGGWQSGSVPGPLIDEPDLLRVDLAAVRALNDEGQTSRARRRTRTSTSSTRRRPGKRLVVSTNATDGQLSLSLYSQSADARARRRRTPALAPGTPVTEQSGPAAQPAESGADAGREVAGQMLIDQAVVGGDGIAQVEAASTDAAAGERLLVRVTSGNGEPSASLYSLRVQYLDEAPRSRARRGRPRRQRTPATRRERPGDRCDEHDLPLRQQRYGDTYGAEAAVAGARRASTSLTGDGHVGDGGVDGAVLAVDTDPAVQAARAALDENPCSMQARASAHVGDQRVRVARSSATTAQHPLGRHRRRRRHHPARARRPAHLAVHRGEPRGRSAAAPRRSPASRCPTSAARRRPVRDAAVGRGRDVPHPDRRPVRPRDRVRDARRYLYVPTVALGRLVETPDQIMATIDRFLAADGTARRPTRRSPAATAHGASCPQDVTASLAWRSVGRPARSTAPGPPTRPRRAAVPRRRRRAPRVVSVNTHADETRMLPGVPGAEDGSVLRRRPVHRRRPRGRPALAGVAHLRHRLPRRQQPADAPTTATSPTGSTCSPRRAATSATPATASPTTSRRRWANGCSRCTPTGSASRSTATAGLVGRRAHVRQAVLPRRARSLLRLRREGAHAGGVLRPADVHLRPTPTKARAAARDARPDARDGRRAHDGRR